MGNNKTKNIILAVLVVGIVSMTVAFASLTQQLNITNNQATVSTKWRVRFNETVTTSVGTTVTGTTTGASYTNGTPTVTNDQQTITGLQATFTKPGDYVEVAFTVRNEGNIAAKGQGVTLSLGNLTCAPGSGSSVSQEAANTFCTKLVKWVKHSDRVTDWTSADTLAAYSGSGAYPSIDGILRIEYPSTLSNSDIAAISGGSIVVTLGDTTLNFEQDDNVTASNNSGSGSGGNETPSNPYLTTFDGSYTYIGPGGNDSGTLLDPQWSAYSRNDGTINEVCAVFGSGQASTVCIKEIGNGDWNTDFPEDYESEYPYNPSNTSLNGYTKAKLDEMLSKGANQCEVNYDSGYAGCSTVDGLECHISEYGSVACYAGNFYCYPGNCS